MAYIDDVLESGVCPRCEHKRDDIEQQYSFGVYAGVMCKQCAIDGFRDQCGHGGQQGDPSDLDEPYYEEE